MKVWRLLDEQNRELAELVCDPDKCSKLSKHLLSTYSSPCISVKIVYTHTGTKDTSRYKRAVSCLLFV
jgi:hypothetical protein